MITLGGLALVFTFYRIFIFKLPETPRYLLSKGRDKEAVDAVNYVARRNGKPEPLTLAMLEEIDIQLGVVDPNNRDNNSNNNDNNNNGGNTGLSNKEILKENLKSFHGVQYKALFATRKLGIHTTITWFIWLTIGMPLPLPLTPSHYIHAIYTNFSLLT